MGIISPSLHRVLDFVVVLLFAAAPTVFNLHGNTMYAAYALAVIHLGMTLLTHFPGTTKGSIPFNVHGIVEAIVGVALVGAPLVRHWTFGARKFYLGMGILILLVWALTRYRDEQVVTTTTTDARPAI